MIICAVTIVKLSNIVYSKCHILNRTYDIIRIINTARSTSLINSRCASVNNFHLNMFKFNVPCFIKYFFRQYIFHIRLNIVQ